jgi:POT family proton-dependent oligopeptide transporter
MTTAVATAPETGFESRVGHPPGLFVLFFAEMWERFSYYGMRALLVFYMTKGFLQYDDKRSYAVYGAYTALVYATPFIGGMIADKLLGARKAVVLGGILMAIGHLIMTVEQTTAFFTALALLIVGNGFFKPNISTIVGGLYPEGSGKRDSGFTLFYMGINLGAALAPLLCGYIGETYGWHYGFGLATIGMLIGLAVFVLPSLVTQILIGAGALGAAGAMFWTGRADPLMLAVNTPVALALLVAAFMGIWALNHGALPNDAARPPRDAEGRDISQKKLLGPLSVETTIYLGSFLAIPVLAFLVQRDTLASYALSGFGLIALGSIFLDALRSEKKERERLFVVLILMFFSMLFWAFFEQAGSSVNNFTDRNVDRVVEARAITAADVGQVVAVPLNQEQLGHEFEGKVVTLDALDAARSAKQAEVQWTITEKDVGMGVGGSEIPASTFQATNPIFILVFGLVFSALWSFLGKRGLEPSTPVKFSMGLAQLGAGFAALWYGAQTADSDGMVAMTWLILAYLLHTTGELCLSPVGLSMVTRLSPTRIVSTVMGGWFLATAFSNVLGAFIAQLTGVGHGEEGAKTVPPPIDTVHVYGDVFGQIAVISVIAGVVLLALSPVLKRWMHEEPGSAAPSHGH